MEWFWIAIQVYLGWTIAAILFPLTIGLIVLIIFLLFQIPKILKQRLCKHTNFRETRSCDAICNDCGKRLGFIGTWREKVKNV